jgi:hypothetical protein
MDCTEASAPGAGLTVAGRTFVVLIGVAKRPVANVAKASTAEKHFIKVYGILSYFKMRGSS